jgi:hypothetical protein
MITDRERQTALDMLNQTRQVLLDSVSGVSDSQARWKPAPDRWSILEYVEHLAVGDDALVALIEHSLKSERRPETIEERREREQKIRATVAPRGANQAPPTLRPAARFSSLGDAVSAFLAARERTLEFARSTQADLRHHFANHSVFGPLDGYQWLTGNARHVETHCSHIRELRGMPEFPPA